MGEEGLRKRHDGERAHFSETHRITGMVGRGPGDGVFDGEIDVAIEHCLAAIAETWTTGHARLIDVRLVPLILEGLPDMLIISVVGEWAEDEWE